MLQRKQINSILTTLFELGMRKNSEKSTSLFFKTNKLFKTVL